MQCASICNTRLADSNTIYRTLPKVMTQHIFLRTKVRKLFLLFALLWFSNAYNMKTNRDIKKMFSQKVWNYMNAILSVVFMISFHRVFMTSTERWFKFVFTVPENWPNWFSWKFFSRYLGHTSRSERSIFEISWKLKSAEFFEKCVRPVFMTLFCKNKEEKIVQTWNVVHI